MISFRVKTPEIAKAALGRLQLIYFAESLGGVETLLTYPIEQTHKETPPELLAKAGVDDRLLRLSVVVAVATIVLKMLAWWLTEVMVIWSEGVVKELAGLYNSNFRLVGMGAFDGFNLILLGALLGLIASWFSVHRHIRDIEPS